MNEAYESLKKQLEIIERFVTSEMSVEEFVSMMKTNCNEQAQEVKLEEIPEDIRRHEEQHARIIEKYNLSPKFYRIGGVYSCRFEIEKIKSWERERVLKFLFELYSAPSSFSSFDHLVCYLIYAYYPNVLNSL